MPKTPASCKAKGRRLQQQVAADILAAFGDLQEDDVASCGMGQHGEDVCLSPFARRLLPWSIECKNVERLNVWSAFAQAEANCREHTPVVVAKRNRCEPLCVMRWSDALRLAQRGAAAHGHDAPTGALVLPPAPDGTVAWLGALAAAMHHPDADAAPSNEESNVPIHHDLAT